MSTTVVLSAVSVFLLLLVPSDADIVATTTAPGVEEVTRSKISEINLTAAKLAIHHAVDRYFQWPLSEQKSHRVLALTAYDPCVEETNTLWTSDTYNSAKSEFFANAKTICDTVEQDGVELCAVRFGATAVVNYEKSCLGLDGQTVDVPTGVVSCVMNDLTSASKTSVFDVYDMVDCISLSCDARKTLGDEWAIRAFGTRMVELLHGKVTTSPAKTVKRIQCQYVGVQTSSTSIVTTSFLFYVVAMLVVAVWLL